MFKSCVSKHTQGLGVKVLRVLLSGGGFWQLLAQQTQRYSNLKQPLKLNSCLRTSMAKIRENANLAESYGEFRYVLSNFGRKDKAAHTA